MNYSSTNPTGRQLAEEPVKIFHRDENAVHTWSPDYAPMNGFVSLVAKYHLMD